MAPVVADVMLQLENSGVSHPTFAGDKKGNQKQVATIDDEENKFFGAVMYRVRQYDCEDVVDGTVSREDIGERCPQREEALSCEQQKKYKYFAEELDKMAKELERSYAASSYRIPTVRDFIASADNYDRFAAMISAASSSDPNTNQLVLFYNLSCEIFTYAATSDAGVNLMNWAKTYFRQNLLPWIINNNGLENCIQPSPPQLTDVAK